MWGMFGQSPRLLAAEAGAVLSDRMSLWMSMEKRGGRFPGLRSRINTVGVSCRESFPDCCFDAGSPTPVFLTP